MPRRPPAARPFPLPPDLDPVTAVFTLRVTLAGVAPPVWRRVEVPGLLTLQQLHAVLQAVMGWDWTHTHKFEIGDQRVDTTDDGAPRSAIEPTTDGSTITLLDAARLAATFTYVYDMGDRWEHAVEIEAVGRAAIDAKYPRCVDGVNACPPEDCGGPSGYAELLATMRSPRQAGYEDTMELLGDVFDGRAFDLAAANATLGRMFGQRKPPPKRTNTKSREQ